MSKVNITEEEFQVVKRKRSSRAPSRVPPQDVRPAPAPHRVQQAEQVEQAEQEQRVRRAAQELRGSEYWAGVRRALQPAGALAEILCLGLGHFSQCVTSRYQLALLTLLREHWAAPALAHDPVFYPGECRTLRNLGVEVIEVNEEGRRELTRDGTTLVYLPHCPKQLTNNFLWRNWSRRLTDCVLVCNSFSALVDNNPDRILVEEVPYIHKIYPHVKEVSLDNNFKFTDIFNDTSAHFFPESELSTLSQDFWIKDDKPKYKDTTEFITSLMIDKLKL